jgi:hypothetical protein
MNAEENPMFAKFPIWIRSVVDAEGNGALATRNVR